jgi:hypothetical protein
MVGKRLGLLVVLVSVPLAVVTHVLIEQRPADLLSIQVGQVGPALRAAEPVPLAHTLRVAIRLIRRDQDWRGPGWMRMHYAFEWVEKREGKPLFGCQRYCGDLGVRYWDAAGNRLPPEQGWVWFRCPTITLYRGHRHEGTCTFSSPPGAKWVAVGFPHLGDEGIMSEKFPLPEE